MFNVLNGNYKGHLLEIASKNFGVTRPEYFHFEYGPSHAKVFHCICIFGELTSRSEGRTKVEAEQFASRTIIEKVKNGFLKKKETLLTDSSKGSLDQEMIGILAGLKSDMRFDIWALYGDAVLRYYILRDLFNRYPQFQEGIHTRIADNALKQDTRASLARILLLDKYVRTEATERTRAETLSAVIGKLVFSNPDSKAIDLVMNFYQSFNDRAVTEILRPTHSDTEISSAIKISTHIHNFKNKLLEFAQKAHFSLPAYNLTEKVGPEHNPEFTVECAFIGYSTTGSGKTIKSAEQMASQEMLKIMHIKEAEMLRVLGPSSSSSSTGLAQERLDDRMFSQLKANIRLPFLEMTENLNLAFTHPSQNGEKNYQALELLGDAILEKLLLEHIVKNYSEIKDKAYLSDGMDKLVSAATQAKVARILKLEQFVFTTAPITVSVLSDVLEALIAAIYLDTEFSSINQVKAGIISWFSEEIQNIFEKPKMAETHVQRDNKPSTHAEPSSSTMVKSFTKLESQIALTPPGETNKKRGYAGSVSASFFSAPAEGKKAKVEKLTPDLNSLEEFPSLGSLRKG